MSESNAFSVSRYLSEEEVLDNENPFVQLLSGVVWLIRNGSVYINESQAAECDETQETGLGAGCGIVLLRTRTAGLVGEAILKSLSMYYSRYRGSMGIMTNKVPALGEYITKKIDL